MSNIKESKLEKVFTCRNSYGPHTAGCTFCLMKCSRLGRTVTWSSQVFSTTTSHLKQGTLAISSDRYEFESYRSFNLDRIYLAVPNLLLYAWSVSNPRLNTPGQKGKHITFTMWITLRKTHEVIPSHTIFFDNFDLWAIMSLYEPILWKL